MIVNTYQILDTYTYKSTNRYKVKCLVCGKIKTVSSSGLQKFCDCVTYGKLFANLFAYEKYSLDSISYCKCVCQLCGTLTTVDLNNLKSGHTKSCGCLRTNDLTGKTFGKLTVGKSIKKGRKTYYYCLCGVCGKTILKRYDTIPTAISCGCDRKEERAEALRQKSFIDGTQPSKIRLDKPPSKANKSGVTGVNWNKAHKKWQAGIRFKGHKYNLGEFDEIADAIEARKEAEKNIFGSFIEWYENIKKKP